jgi:hypothetical protein
MPGGPIPDAIVQIAPRANLEDQAAFMADGEIRARRGGHLQRALSPPRSSGGRSETRNKKDRSEFRVLRCRARAPLLTFGADLDIICITEADVMASTTFKTLCVRVPIDLAGALDRLRAETGITRSEAVRRALDRYLATRAEKFLQPADAIRVVSPTGGEGR